jgi:DNA topoisomerase-1
MNDYLFIDNIEKLKNNKTLSQDNIEHIKKLKIPPNWKNVKISQDYSAKIQAIGEDNKGRKQYIYHPLWIIFSKQLKYSKVNSINFDKFNKIINKLSKNSDNYSKDYIISNMFLIMRDLNIRVGNEKYLEENDSVGLCTLEKHHYKKEKKVNKIIYKFVFKGKKGILHEKILNEVHIKFIENIIRIPGNELFKYNDKNNNIYKKIIADDLNLFLKENIDPNMTTKDIRTYSANIIFQKEYNRLLKSGINKNKSRIEAMKLTAIELGNTPKVCRDSYIDPSLYK